MVVPFEATQLRAYLLPLRTQLQCDYHARWQSEIHLYHILT